MKCNLLNAEHSPIRLLRFVFLLEDIPYYVSNHLVRHHVGCTPFVRSQRNDRQDSYDRNAARQDAPVSMMWELNAQSLIDVSHKRLCGMADQATRNIVTQMCKMAIRACPRIPILPRP
jgi:Thymidylate synthase complementing protein.